MALHLSEIERIQRNLAHAAPELREEIEALVKAASKPPTPVEYVEVTRTDGTQEVMAAADYQRLTAMDLAHVNLHVLSPSRSRAHEAMLRGDKS